VYLYDSIGKVSPVNPFVQNSGGPDDTKEAGIGDWIIASRQTFEEKLDNPHILNPFFFHFYLSFNTSDTHQLQTHDLPRLFDPYAHQGQMDITTCHYQFHVT
jgi:hypothetical protein